MNCENCWNKMFHKENAEIIQENILKSEFWICWNCGIMTHTTTEILDDDDLQSYKDNYIN